MGYKIKKTFSDFLFEYDTPRMVLVRDKKVGLTFRLIQLGVLGYIIGWVFLYEKGYQSVDGIISSVSVKMKGLGVTNFSNMGVEIWDAVDYVFPPQGDSSFVVMTNFIITPEQKLGFCNELPDAAPCETDDDCKGTKRLKQGESNEPSMSPSGVLTGNCTFYNETFKTCQAYSWCPIENDYVVPKPPLLLAAENFTLFIKNSITFPNHRVSRQNLVETVTSNYLKKCLYHKKHDPLCPVFRLGYIVEEAGLKFSDIAYKGGTVGIVVDWHCDLDWPVKYCVPTYHFHALDDAGNKASQGFNFRNARYYREDGINKRTLFKVFGIRFDILVNGEGGKFNIIPTMTTIGSGIGIFGVATVVCDLMLLHILPKRNYYKEKKFKCAKVEQKTTPEKEDDLSYSNNSTIPSPPTANSKI
ncbi:P2X purinoceptor 1 [Discoglossus pictus]